MHLFKLGKIHTYSVLLEPLSDYNDNLLRLFYRLHGEVIPCCIDFKPGSVLLMDEAFYTEDMTAFLICK